MEKIPNYHFIRHAPAQYLTEKEILTSTDPARALNRKEQISPDLTPEKKIIAKEKAEQFFSAFDKETDSFIFFSSDEARAMETADIYRIKAEELGHEIISPFHNDIKGNGKIRTLEALSIQNEYPLLNTLFDPKTENRNITWAGVDEKLREQWQVARSIVEDNDQGTWGKNFFYHSKKIKEKFPELKSVEELREQFKHIMRLINFAEEKKKKQNNGSSKQIHVLGFGHETYMADILNEYFNEYEIGNCESIGFSVEDGEINIQRRGIVKKLI